MTHYLAIDIETTGPGIHSHRMVAIGAAVIDTETCERVDSFRALLAFGDHTDGRPADWEERCYREFWTNSDKRADGQTPLNAIRSLYDGANEESEAEAMHRFVAWARANFDKYPKMVVITDTASFDTTFINAALDRHTDVWNLVYLRGPDSYRPVRDVSSFHMGVGRKTPAQGFWGAERAATEALGISLEHLPKAAHDHDPRNDATYIGRVAATIARAVDRSLLIEHSLEGTLFKRKAAKVVEESK